MATVLLPFPEDMRLAQAVATRCGARLGFMGWRHFPDGESLVTVEDDLADADVVLLCSLNQPDRKAMALRFAAHAARELGARSVGLVAPYLAYMRQDASFHPGEAISAHAFARFLEEAVDWLVTVDPHLHRIPTLDSLFRIPAQALAAAPSLAGWIAREVPRPHLIGPDSESEQWVSEVAKSVGAPYTVLEKVRHGDRSVEIRLPRDFDLQGRTPVLVDDIVSSGRTLVAILEQLRGFGLPAAVCVVIHAVFADGALDALREAGAGRVVSTDSVAHESSAISLADPIARAVAARLSRTHAEPAT